MLLISIMSGGSVEIKVRKSTDKQLTKNSVILRLKRSEGYKRTIKY